jgi:signal transduction histidine kinase
VSGVGGLPMTRAMTEERPDGSLDRYARLVHRTLDVPVSLVTFVRTDRQVFPGCFGLPPPYDASRETPLSHSFCQYVVADRAPLVVSDARRTARVCDNPAVAELGVIAYAGWPLRAATGDVVGSLCAIDTVPREWREEELDDLSDLAAACSAEIAHGELVGLMEVVDELERSNALLSAFAAQVSHDLRSPLTALAGSLELLDGIRPRSCDEQQTEMGELIGRARRSAARMSALINDVLSFALVDGALDRAIVDVAELVGAVLEDLQLDPDRVQVSHLAPVVADPAQLHALIQNVVANAVAHAPGSPIEITAAGDDLTWRLTVTDHGPGVDPLHRERVFDPFVRLSTRVAGSGLGLATCRRIARAHGGDVELGATPGGGATVVVTLPTGG